jgi:DMSO/TMAO reductase YedYZ molybdopterin-dependent catalytic subunit
VPTLRDRLPADLRDAPWDPDLDASPFTPLYLLDDEFAAEIVNRTVHGIMHVGWVPDGAGGYRGEMAVYVRPAGLLGAAYLAAIKPLRYLIVYPALLERIGRAWRIGIGAPALRGTPGVALPPGQRPIGGFPRFGTHLHRPAPAVPTDHVIEVSGAVANAFVLPLAELATLPRRECAADFHCVAGWSATNLRWEGVAFATLYRTIIEPSLHAATPITHVVFAGLDGYRSVVSIEDALEDDVLIADHLDGRPLDSDHGAPVRLVSPSQYGFVSTKHLCRIELRTAVPTGIHTSPAMRLLKPHPRARVREEERHGALPGWLVRPVYRLLIPPIAFLSARGSRVPDP